MNTRVIKLEVNGTVLLNLLLCKIKPQTYIAFEVSHSRESNYRSVGQYVRRTVKKRAVSS